MRSPIHYIGYVAMKDLKFVKIGSVNPFYLFFHESEWILWMN